MINVKRQGNLRRVGGLAKCTSRKKEMGGDLWGCRSQSVRRPVSCRGFWLRGTATLRTYSRCRSGWHWRQLPEKTLSSCRWSPTGIPAGESNGHFGPATAPGGWGFGKPKPGNPHFGFSLSDFSGGGSDHNRELATRCPTRAASRPARAQQSPFFCVFLMPVRTTFHRLSTRNADVR